MASAFSHAVVPLAIMIGLGRARRDWRLTLFCMLCAAAPDLDSLAFRLGVPYESQWGHRGFTHSLTVALIWAGVCAAGLKNGLRASPGAVFALVFAATASHAVLDAITDGGLGVAFFWPFDHDRYFLPWRVVEVSPISVRRFFAGRGLEVIRSELLWIWLPCAAGAATLWLARRMTNRKESR